MKMKTTKLFILLTILFSCEYLIYSENKADDENRLQFGFGLITYANAMTVIKSVKKIEAINSNTCYNYPTITKEQDEAFNSMGIAQQRGFLALHIISSIDYGFQW